MSQTNNLDEFAFDAVAIFNLGTYATPCSPLSDKLVPPIITESQEFNIWLLQPDIIEDRQELLYIKLLDPPIIVEHLENWQIILDLPPIVEDQFEQYSILEQTAPIIDEGPEQHILLNPPPNIKDAAEKVDVFRRPPNIIEAYPFVIEFAYPPPTMDDVDDWIVLAPASPQLPPKIIEKFEQLIVESNPLTAIEKRYLVEAAKLVEIRNQLAEFFSSFT